MNGSALGGITRDWRTILQSVCLGQQRECFYCYRKLSSDHDTRCSFSISRSQTAWLQAFPWSPSDQHTAVIGTKAEPVFIRKHDISPFQRALA
ncbi:hypothetical protein TNCV_5063371 [Trichonephila clavipes]|nr:hypothetical protein TNCV_5063371 [Trichonephila clavipes]